MNVTPLVLWSLDDWADAVASLPVEGLLPRRQVLVPNERVAHSLRRRLVEREQQSALVGTRFLSLLTLAQHVVVSAGEEADASDGEVARLLAHEAFATTQLERLDPRQLQDLPGWDSAFAETMRELESAGVPPEALVASDDAHVRDVGRVFASVAARHEWSSTGRLLYRAARLLQERRARVELVPTLAVLTGFESAAEAALLARLPAVRLARWVVRPERSEHAARMQRLWGPEMAGAQRQPSFTCSSALGSLQRGLFTAKPAAALPDDESVQVALYAGVHDEVDAAVSWVVEQIVERAVPAQDIALVSPTPEAYASLLRARLGALTWPGEAPLFLERGSPLTERADGARLLSIIRALREGLPREHLANLLPWMRIEEAPDTGLRGVRGLSRAWDLLNVVPCLGGERSHPEGGLTWHEAWQRAVLRLERPVQSSSGLTEHAQRRQQEIQLELAALGPAIKGLTMVMALVASSRPLAELWAGLRDWCERFLKLPPASPPALAVMDALVSAYPPARVAALCGAEALDWLEQELAGGMVRSGRFGMPAVYLGSLSGMHGLSFRAVRVLGLVEGVVPSAVREDAVLCNAARRSLSPLLLTSRERAHRQLASLDNAVRAARDRLVLSAPRVSIDGSARQPAAVLLDVMRALGVPAPSLEETLTSRALLTRSRERAIRDRLPLSRSAQLLRVARGDRGPVTAPRVVTSLAAVRAVAHGDSGVQDGLLPGLLAVEDLPGSTPDRAISASRLSTLLSCAHRFLLEQVLHYREPTEALPGHEIDALSFGSLLHEVAERFWREFGEEFGKRARPFAFYAENMRVMADAVFADFASGYAFRSESVAAAQRARLHDQLHKLLEYDWAGGIPRAFVAVERGFGYEEPCAIDTPAGRLFVRGNIDRLDLDSGTVLVRDLKTGASKARRPHGEPDVGIDLQLGLYARVLESMAKAWRLPRKVGVAYVYLRSGEPERSWIGNDYATLRAASDEWLATAIDTLRAGSFVRSPDAEDCRFCAHKALCEPHHERTQEVLRDSRVPTRLKVLKSGETP